MNESKRIGATVILLNGDTIDCHNELSRFERDPRERKFKEGPTATLVPPSCGTSSEGANHLEGW